MSIPYMFVYKYMCVVKRCVCLALHLLGHLHSTIWAHESVFLGMYQYVSIAVCVCVFDCVCASIRNEDTVTRKFRLKYFQVADAIGHMSMFSSLRTYLFSGRAQALAVDNVLCKWR